MATLSLPRGDPREFPIVHQSELPKMLVHAYQFFKGLVDKWAKKRDHRQTITELRRLTDHDLDDIGVSRGQIALIAHQSTYKKG